MNEIDYVINMSVVGFLGFIIFISSFDNKIKRWLYNPIVRPMLEKVE